MQPSSNQIAGGLDVNIPSPPAEPERGIGATAYRPGVAPDSRRIISCFQTILDYAQVYRRPVEGEWLLAYQQFNGDTIKADKEPWQSQAHIPLAKQAIDTAVARVLAGIFQNQDWFDVEPFSRTDTTVVQMAKQFCKWQLWKSDFRAPVAESTKDGFICGHGPMKIHFRSDVEPKTIVEEQEQKDPVPGMPPMAAAPKYLFRRIESLVRRMRFESIIPTDVWLDPSGQNRFLIHRVRKQVSDLWDGATDRIDPETKTLLLEAIYDKDEVAKVLPGSIDPTAEVLAATIRRDSPLYLQAIPPVDVYEYWGDLFDPQTGAIIYRNVFFTVANKQWLIRKPAENPFRHGGKPFIIFRPGLLPHQVYGYGILKQNATLQDGADRMWNVVMDKATLQVPMLEVDPGAARNPAELMPKPKFYPARVWARRSAERQIWHAVEGFPPPTQVDLEIIDRIVQYYQMSTGVNEFATGQVMTASRKTKTEVEIRSASTQASFNDAAYFIEEHCLSPMLKMTYLNMLQFEDQYDDASLQRMMGDIPNATQVLQQIKAMSDEERYKTLYLEAEFRASGISNQITRDDRIGRLMGYLKFAMADPRMSQTLDIAGLNRKLLKLFDLPPETVLPFADQMIQQMQMAAISSIMQPQPGQTGPAEPGQAGPAGQQGAPQNRNNQMVEAQAEATGPTQ